MNLFASIILTICGLPFLIVGLDEGYRVNLEINHFAHTNGTVVGNSYVNISADGYVSGVYLPEVVFLNAPDGGKIRFTDKIGSLPPDYEVGEQVEVIYNPDQPHEARIYSRKRVWLAPLIFTAVGLLPFIVGIFIFFRLPKP